MTIHLLWRLFYWIWIASEIALVVFTRTRRSSGGIHDRGSLLVLWGSIFASIWIASQIAYSHATNLWVGASWPRLTALLLLIAGLAIRWSAILSLGRSFSVNVAIHSDQQVYRGGLYRLVRHPSYTGMLLIFLALGLAMRNGYSLAIMLVVPTLALLYRIHVEEAALLAAFGPEYAKYCRHTPRLLPGLF